ncbi:UNVERIFIED_CONTAM: hypothetical protein K2H54_058147, partial [Gekko kuhli]
YYITVWTAEAFIDGADIPDGHGNTVCVSSVSASCTAKYHTNQPKESLAFTEP